ncbi:TenA family protein [Sciscionella marina]|uniref:TenA family protein n=1 Tax=Sciscionella marina TaxID=508770 RepID=UPI00037B3598|nr:TenA family protein [Sciscionella marina]
MSFDAQHGTFSEWLRAAAEPDWTAAVTHPFVDGLYTGELAEPVLRRYLVQDYQFVDRFVALLGAAVAGADTVDGRMVLARQLGVIGGGENTYFQRSFTALGVPEADREAPALHPVTEAFNRLMDQARASLDYPSCLIVLTVAEWLYSDWAERAPQTPPRNAICAEWIELHRGPEFTAWVDWLRAELDRLGPGLTAEAARGCRELFCRATTLEREFFDAVRP